MHRRSGIVLLATLSLATAAVACGGPESPADHLAAALERLGGADVVARHGGLRIDSEGTQDRGAELQGTAPGARDPGVYSESLAWLPAASDAAPADLVDPVAFEYDHRRSDGSREWVRELYPAPAVKRIVLVDEAQVIDLVAAEHDRDRARLSRRLPARLIAELLERSERLAMDTAGGTPRISGELDGGERVAVTLEDGLPARVAYPLEMPGMDEVQVTWIWSDYRELPEGGALPWSLEIEVDGRTWVRQQVAEVTTGDAAAELFAPPEGAGEPVRIELPADGDASRNARVEELSPGVWRVRNLRTGFHPLFVELADGILAVDAPSGYPLLAELPAGDVAPGPDAAWLSRRYVELIAATVPDKPITHVVVTHFHGDHAGGLRAFVEAGAEVLAPPGDAAAIADWLGDPAATVTTVDGSLTLDGGRVVVLDLGPNPHTEALLVVRLPDLEWLFVSDLFMPVELERFPLPGHVRLDKAFARWLEGAGFEPERIYTMHTGEPGSAAHLESLRE